MSWVCGICSTNNDDSNDVCFVCGTRREDCVTDSEEEDIACEEIETVSETAMETPKKCSPLVKAISVIFPILSFVIGQIFLYVLFLKEGKVLFLTSFIKASGNYEFNTPLFLSITTGVGVFSCFVAICNNLSLAAKGKEFSIYWITLPYCIMMVLCPSLSACWLLALEFIGIFIINRHAFLSIIILANLFAVITMVAFPALSVSIEKIYSIIFDEQEGSKGIKVKFECDLLSEGTPIKETCIFERYYDSKFAGTQYYNSNMENIRKWDVREDSFYMCIGQRGIFMDMGF